MHQKKDLFVGISALQPFLDRFLTALDPGSQFMGIAAGSALRDSAVSWSAAAAAASS